MSVDVSDLKAADSKLNESIEPGETDLSLEIEEKTPIKETKVCDECKLEREKFLVKYSKYNF